MTTEGLSRRQALTGAAVVGVGLPLLAACGGSDIGATTATDTSGGGGSGTLTATADIPEGGGTIFGDQKVVVTQPTAGDFKCFSAICTHQGCPVTNVVDGTINCACHGSKFSIEDGSVTQGPATTPLDAVKIDVAGGKIKLA